MDRLFCFFAITESRVHDANSLPQTTVSCSQPEYSDPLMSCNHLARHETRQTRITRERKQPVPCRRREREAGLATVVGETLKQSGNSKGPTGPKRPEQPRTECDGEGSLLAYAPLGAMGDAWCNS